jgi:formylglycine-generating enzyme required for sulfatase activity
VGPVRKATNVRLKCRTIEAHACVLIAIVATLCPVLLQAERLAFVTGALPTPDSSVESLAALKAARAWDAAVIVLQAREDGTFATAEGTAAELSGFAVLWVHQGDDSSQTAPYYAPKSVRTLQNAVETGAGLLLSGAALSLVDSLGVDSAVPRRGGPGKDRVTAALVPLLPKHPLFAGLTKQADQVPTSDKGYPAFADFHGTGGPFSGMLLARTPGGRENPVVEYELGKGRIVAIGWRLPHYANAANAHRANLKRLTANALSYLSTPATWQKIVTQPRRAPPSPKPPTTVVDTPAVEALELAIRDLVETFGAEYPEGENILERILAFRSVLSDLDGSTTDAPLLKRFRDLQRDALLANPLLRDAPILYLRRHARLLGLPRNWQSNSSLPKTGYDNEIAVLESTAAAAPPSVLFTPPKRAFVGDIDLRADASRMLFSMPGSNRRWQISELDLKTRDIAELPLINEPDVDNYDACYLPDGDIIFTSTAPFVGVPCVTGSSHVANLFRLDRATGAIRQLTFDQDHDWCPTILNNGRVLYLRWEYSDLPHYVSRILFHMNPDGTEQMAFYGSNSYWPNAMFYARPIPGSATQFVAVVGGHHDSPRMGELVLFDAARGRHEAKGVLQRIPGRGKPVLPTIRDGLVGKSWPKFLHPFPLAEPVTNRGAGKYFLVAAKPHPSAQWGIYLADVFDNLVLIREERGYALFEPQLLRPTRSAPVVPDRTDQQSKEATVLLTDVYNGPGLAGVPRGEVRSLRLITYHFAYHGMGGQVNRVGLDGPWDIKRVLGTVPVRDDGSACFRIPANTPIAIQPLDADGQALQLMRSWFVGMPGEVVSCAGCHEEANSAPPPRRVPAARHDPDRITPWYGPTRGFSFKREVQPVLDRRCISCHNGTKGRPDFRAAPPVHPAGRSKTYNNGTAFTPSYLALRRYVRSHTIESDMHLLSPGEFHAETTVLIRRLKAGHHNVALTSEEWDRITTWIDLATPAHGTWHEIVGWKKVTNQRDRRKAMLARYAGRTEDPEEIPPAAADARSRPRAAAVPQITASRPPSPKATPAAPPGHAPLSITVDDGIEIDFRWIPRDDSGFWMSSCEVRNAAFGVFAPDHDSRLEHGDFLQFSIRERGYPVNGPDQPTVRISWDHAAAFCDWLSKRSGKRILLPSEAEWEWACRAGMSTPLWFGDTVADFAAAANLADSSLQAIDTFGFGLPSGAVPPWRPAVNSVDDHHRVSAPVGSFAANTWGLYDMHGNAAEWTRTPARDHGGKTVPENAQMIVKGGSWYDRPADAQITSRRAHKRYLGAFDIGFRLVCLDRPADQVRR